MEVLKGLKKFTGRFKSTAERNLNEDENKTDLIVCSRKRVVSSPSSPVHEMTDDTFWVPPEMIHRKRAQSLVPTIQNDSEEDSSSGTLTPPSMCCFKDTSSSPQAITLMSSDSMPLVHPQVNRQRRASMQDAIDFRKIDSKLYDGTLLQRQMSVGSVKEDQLGSLKFSIYFNEGTNVLTVYLISAQNLAPSELSETLDPCCKLCILPDHRQQLQSKIHRKTANPLFDEEFVFDVHKETLEKIALLILVYNCDECTRNECIGQVKLPLTNIDFNQRQIMCMPLAQREEKNYQELDTEEPEYHPRY